ncbi:MAG: A24 family peptidase [Merdibacter sp.]
MISLLCGMLALNALLRHYQAQLRPLSLVLLTAGAWGLSVCADDLRTAFFRDAQLLTLIAIAQIDRKRMIIPDRLSLALLIVGLLSGNLPSLGQMLIGMSVPALLMQAMDHLWKPCFGMGDIKLCLVCGMLGDGFPACLAAVAHCGRPVRGAAAHQKAVQAGQPSALCAMDRPCGCGIPAGDFPGSSAIMREMR